MSTFSNPDPTESLYKSVIADVCRNIRDAFLNEGVDEQVLKELREKWETRLKQTGSLSRTPVDLEGASFMPSRSQPGHHQSSSVVMQQHQLHMARQQQKKATPQDPITTSVQVVRQPDRVTTSGTQLTQQALQQIQQQRLQTLVQAQAQAQAQSQNQAQGQSQNQAQSQSQTQGQNQTQSQSSSQAGKAVSTQNQTGNSTALPQVLQYPSGIPHLFYQMPGMVPVHLSQLALSGGNIPLSVLTNNPMQMPTIQLPIATTTQGSPSSSSTVQGNHGNKQSKNSNPSQVDGNYDELVEFTSLVDKRSGDTIEVELVASDTLESDATLSLSSLPPFLMTRRKNSRRAGRHAVKKVESKSAVGEGVQRRQRKVKAFVQLDGPHGDSSSEDEEEEESDDEEAEGDRDSKADDDDNPLNSEDDDDLTDGNNSEDGNTDIIICQFDKVTRSNKVKWKFYLKNGIMSVRNRDYVFQKANGEAEW